jgi:hypothetical protein
MDHDQLATLFEEWKRRYDEDPAGFDDCEAFKAKPPKSYGDGAATYFLWLLNDLDHGGLGS